MKKFHLTLIAFLLAGSSLFSQPLSGTKTIPGDYASLKLAISALNSNGVGPGGVIFNISADYKEVFTSPTAGHIITTTGSSSSPITFQRSGTGANPLVTAGIGAGSMDAVFLVAGGDFITFDGIDIKESADNYEPVSWMEWGFAILKYSATNGSQNITIKNCSITLDIYNINGVGIYSNNHTAGSTVQLTITSTSGANSNLKFYANTLTNCYRGIYVKGFGDSSPYTFFDQNNEIGKDGPNTITNIGGGNVIPYGIYTIYQNNLKVANNTITSAMEGSTHVYGIYLTNSNNASYDLYNNTVSLQFTSTAAANPGYNENFYAVYCDMGASGTSNSANIYNNTVTNCSYSNVVSAVVNLMYFYNMGVTANVYGNVVSNNTVGSSLTNANGVIRYFWCQKLSTTAGPMVVHDNTVTGNSRIIPSPLSATTYMLVVTGSGTSLNEYNNTVSNNTVASQGATYCLYNSFNDASGKYVYNNFVSNIMEANGTVHGLYNANGTTGYFYNNRIQGIHASPTAPFATIYGINHGAETIGLSVYYYNNMISDLTNPGANATPGLAYNMLSGFNVEGSVGSFKGFYNNTVYLNSTATNSSEYGSSAFSTQRLADVELRNNIFINTSASAGSNGKTVGIRSREAGLGGFASNNNNIYCGVPGAANLIFTDGTNLSQTLSEYKAFVTPNELQSVTSMPPFENITTAPFDLHVKTTTPTACESGGTIITTPLAINSDFDNQPRYPNPGYPVHPSISATAPDLGADEFGGIPDDLTAPAIIYTPLSDINHGNARTLTATIEDPSGVPTTGFGLPVLYWKKNNGTYIPVQGIYGGNHEYSFTFGGGASLNDVISYYIVAQDNMLPFPNVGSSPFGGAAGFTANPPSCTTPPVPPSGYTVILDISGVKHIGVGKDYTTLTAAAADLNSKYMAGPVTFILDDNIYPNEIFPIKFNERAGNSPVNTLTIKPNAGANPVIAGASYLNGIIVMNGIDYVTVDGSNNGTSSKNLTIQNTSSSGNAHAFGITNHGGTDPSTHIILKNCTLRGNNSNIVVENCVIYFNYQGGLTGGGYDNCVITNNAILKAKYGIRVLAVSGNMNRDITISDNIISSADTADYLLRGGIEVTESENTIISGNEIFGWANGTGELFEFGMIIYGNCPNTKIHRNKIHDIYSLGWGAYGIKYSNESNNPPSEIFNNVIYDIRCWGANPGVGNNLAYGIFIRRGSNVKIWHNSIYLSGPYLAGSDNYQPSSACIGVYEAATTDLDIRDNILRNSMTNPSNPPPGSGNDGRAYGIMFSGSLNDFSGLEYNTYYIDGYRGSIAMRWINGVGFGDFFETLDQWQNYTGMEIYGDTLNPMFVSDTTPNNLHPTNQNLNSTGGPKILDTDYDGAPRYTPPDRGAYEWSMPITDYHTLAATSVTSTGAILNGDINTKGEYVEVHFDYGTTLNYGSVATPNPSVVRSAGTLLPVNASITGLQPNTTYHFRFWGIPKTSGQSNIYGADLTFTTGSDIPVNITLQGDTIHAGHDTCFNATNTITVAGNGATFVVENGGAATMIAGQKIVYLPGTKVQPGGYMHGYITQNGVYCNIPVAPLAAMKAGTEENFAKTGTSMFRIYPNPTSGAFIIETTTDVKSKEVSVEIYGIRGEMVLKTNFAGSEKQVISLDGQHSGIYFIRLTSEGKSETGKVIKQ